MLRKKRHLWLVLSILILLFNVSACESQKQQTHDQLVVDGSGIHVPLPQRLRNIEEIDPTAISVIAIVGGVETELQRGDDGRFSGQFSVPAQSRFTVQIEYIELYQGQQLTLARAEKSVTTSSGDTSLSLMSEDYDFSSFDFDGDTASNIVERQFNTSPLDSSQLPELVSVDVFAELPLLLSDAGFTAYQLVGSVGGESVAVDASIGQFRHTFTVLKQDSLTVTMQLVEGVTGQNLTIGQHEARRLSSSQFNAQDNALVVFNGASWNLDSDQDGDGIASAEELIAGTDILTVPASNRIPYLVSFDVPVEIVNPQSVFATLEIDGLSTALNRMADTYTASGTAVPGTQVSLSVQIVDTVQGTALLLATFSGTATPIENGTLQLQGFSTEHDDDNDGVQNYLELAQGTDPFSSEMQCVQVAQTLFANLTDDAYVQNSTIRNDEQLRVDSNRRVTLMRFQYDESLGEVTQASLNLTVGTDAGDGLVSVSAIENFNWSDQSSSLTVPTGNPVGSAENVWQAGVVYSFSLAPGALSGDVTLILRQADGDDIAFESSAAASPPTLELRVERCL